MKNILFFLCILTAPIFSQEFKREFFETHSYIEIKDANGQFHYLHDPDCGCSDLWFMTFSQDGAYIFRYKPSHYD